jgi:hypothetical protein
MWTRFMREGRLPNSGQIAVKRGIAPGRKAPPRAGSGREEAPGLPPILFATRRAGRFARFHGILRPIAPANRASSVPADEPACPRRRAPRWTRRWPGVAPRLAAAREKLDARDLPGALAIYEEVLASPGTAPTSW